MATSASKLPTIASLNPASAVAGGPAFTLTINGANFTSNSVAMWGANALKTTYVNAAQLTAAVPSSLIATPGTAGITVTAASGASSAAAFTITYPPPSITNLSPASVSAGHAFTMTISGRNFVSLASVKLGSTPLTTTFVNSAQLTAAVPAALVSTAGKALVTVSTAGGTSAAAPLSVTSSAPTITSLTPNSVVAGSSTLTLTVNGTNFLPGTAASVVKWNYTPLATTYVSCTQLTAVVPASLMSGSGTVNISVATSAGNSSSLLFTVNPAPPVIASLSPARVPAGFGAFVLFVNGTHFSSTATVNFGNTPLVTSPLGGAWLLANVPASLVASVGNVNVTVTTAGGTSAPSIFTILQPQPVISSLSPSSAPAGGGAFTLTINGANFNSTSYCLWQGTHLATTFVSSTQLTVSVPASMIATAGTYGIVVNTLGGSGVSTAASFVVKPAPPAISSLTPATVTAGSAGFMLTVKGSAFTPSASVVWDTTPLGTVYVGPTQLIAAVPASLIVNSGTESITVTTPAGTSALASLTIKQAAPAITSLTPGLASVGGVSFTLTVDGEYFTPGATVKWGSTVLATVFVSQTELTAAVPSSLITSAGSAKITVVASGGVSAPATFIVNPAPKILTTTLPPATAGSAYSGLVKVTGGVPGYTWTVAGLPDNMSFSNTSGDTLTIAGTPAEPGTVNLQISATDTTGVKAGPVPFTLNIANGPNGANNARLNGTYVCLLQGFIDDDGTRWASLASFQADGQGHFNTGAFDTNSQDIGSASGTINGIYSVGSDFNGMASLHTVLTDGAAGIQTTQWALALASSSSPAQGFRMVEADDLGERPSGQQGSADCRLATPSAFSAGTIDGSSFAFSLDGEDWAGILRAASGLFNASAGKIVSGSIDMALGGNPSAQSAAFTGSYTSPDPVTGRFKIAIKGTGKVSGLTVYIIDASRMFVLDNTSNYGEQAGNMRRQLQSAYSAANLNGLFVLYLRGAEFNSPGITPSGYYADLYQGSGDGQGNLTINQSYIDNNSVYSAGSVNGSTLAPVFDSAHPGRAISQSVTATTYLYLFGNTSAFEMSVSSNGSLDTGWLEPQAIPQNLTASTTATPAGNYLFGEQPLLDGKSDGSLGELDLASGQIDGAQTAAGEEFLSWDQPSASTYSWDTAAIGTGAFLIANGAPGPASCALVNPAKFVCVSQTDPAPSIEIAEQ